MYSCEKYAGASRPSCLDILPVPETLNIIPLDIIPDRFLDLFRYYSLDTVPGPQMGDGTEWCLGESGDLEGGIT